ncbi:hypothetical protein Tco_0991985 [Tanacetum coccineum]|uniref:Uncharacterized protein n=1 Tax=Tanacetum coccineum TaxID=301880 RepID=A0ABQ5F0S4_9ASTR
MKAMPNNEGKEILEEDWKEVFWLQENRNMKNTRRVVPMETTTSNALISYDGSAEVETSEAKASLDKPKVVRKNNGALIIEEWGNPQQDLKDQGVIDSGYSRHMTGNKPYLTDFEEIDGGICCHFGGKP